MFKQRFLSLVNANNLKSFTTLSKATNIPNSTISHWLNEDKKPSMQNLITLADYFEVSIDYLVGRDIELDRNNLLHSQFSENDITLLIKIKKLNFAEQKLCVAYIDGINDSKTIKSYSCSFN